jgi:hypothetical protein
VRDLEITYRAVLGVRGKLTTRGERGEETSEGGERERGVKRQVRGEIDILPRKGVSISA